MNFYYQIEKFVIDVADKYDAKGKKLLDIGAQVGPYRKCFQKLQYFSHDIEQNDKHSIDIVADLNKGLDPVKSNSFDYVLCTQVLEHVQSPERVMSELNRILKPKGKLFLTTNFIYQIHSSPHDYYRFTEYGLRHLGEKSGFKITKLESQGGVFHTLTYIMSTLPLRLLMKEGSTFYWTYIIIFSPVIIFFNLLAYLLDHLDKKRELTINYAVIYEKI